MLLINKILDQLIHTEIFIKFDIKNVYYCIRIRFENEWKIAFRIRYGLFEYCVMLFGLINVPAIFQLYINRALSELLDDFVVVYLDDILIYSKNKKDHCEYIKKVLKRFR